MHCHVGIENREIGLKLMNQACYFCLIYLRFPLILLLGRQTYRLQILSNKVFDKFPRTGLPEYFESVASYDNFLDFGNLIEDQLH
jgi:carboxylate-amine ligase